MNSEQEPVIIEPYEERRQADPAKNRFFLYDEDFEEERNPLYQPIDSTKKLHRPHYPVGEIAPWVFARNSNWLKNRLRNYGAVLRVDGSPLTFRFIVGRGARPERRLTLPDIERLAWALYDHGSIDGLALQRASQILVAVAHQYGALVGEDGKKIT
ncbi:hypothetical protein [Streptomyces sp. NPDC088752]|uniref:DUF7229 domain-containing protein n=1 Tax=Streptomyces sp. NPDC088752 TaxID=3154963 RepID=UPI00344971CA